MTQAADSRSIMLAFAAATGLSDSSQPVRRYLWTDAFAVCNFLGLFRQSGDQAFLKLALALVDQVHQVLGQHRADSDRHGWLSGLDAEQARLHPTSGGLRIGKPLAERKRGEAYRDALEWERDGQYFHYLTKWMHALYRVYRETGRDDYLRWALELAKTSHHAFTHIPAIGGPPRMYWKMSVDLTRPLVDSMGQHDPLDGLITWLQLDSAARHLASIPSELDLQIEIGVMREMNVGLNCVSADPLGIGGLLTDAFRLVQLIDNYRLDETARLEALVRDIDYSLQYYITQNQLGLPAKYRLAFRELGLAIGLHAIVKMQDCIAKRPESFSIAGELTALLGELAGFRHLHASIEDFWCENVHRMSETWRQHADINEVMLATALSPDGFLSL
jgi:hypothetical protein